MSGKTLQTHHMTYHWHRMVDRRETMPAVRASLHEKATLIGRIGIMMLSFGTGAYRVRESMDKAARIFGVTCSADIGLVSIGCTVYQNERSVSQNLSLATTGINTDKLYDMQRFLHVFEETAQTKTADEIHRLLDEIQKKPGHYTPLQLGLAAGLACGAFTFLLGGGRVEMLCAFLGAGIGNYLKTVMGHRKLTQMASVMCSVAAACLIYVLAILGAERILGVPEAHEAGYICAMLFIVPGFPLITGGIDIAKFDMRSGLERISYALLTILVATVTGWAIAQWLQFAPSDLRGVEMSFALRTVLRLLAGFCGVFGFSLMYNSTLKMASCAGIIGALASTMRLTLVGFGLLPTSVAAFFGALLAGLLASAAKRVIGYPRISLTVPAIVIMVPGMYMYRGVYNIAISRLGEGGEWLISAFLITMALPLGLIMARFLTDRKFRHVL